MTSFSTSSTVIRYTNLGLAKRNQDELKKIVRTLRKELSDMLSHRDSFISSYYDPDTKIGTIILSYPDLMLEVQRNNDSADVQYVAMKSDYVKQLKEIHEHLPTFTDLYNGIMPEVQIDFEMG